MKQNVILIGMPTAGKSTVGVVLAKMLGCDYVDTDLLIQKQQGCRLEETIKNKGDEAFLDIEADVCVALEAENAVIATGGSVIYRERGMAHLKEIGTLVYLKISPETLKERLNDAASRGVVLKEGQTLDSLYQERVQLYEQYADLTVDEGSMRFEEVVAEVLKLLATA